MLDGKGAGKTRNLRFASVNLDSLNNIAKLPFQRKLMADFIKLYWVGCYLPAGDEVGGEK